MDMMWGIIPSSLVSFVTFFCNVLQTALLPSMGRCFGVCRLLIGATSIGLCHLSMQGGVSPGNGFLLLPIRESVSLHQFILSYHKQ